VASLWIEIVVFSSGLEAEECLFKNEIRSELLLSGFCFGIFIGAPFIYHTFVFIDPLLRVSIRVMQR
jgi:hypothetical protein